MRTDEEKLEALKALIHEALAPGFEGKDFKVDIFTWGEGDGVRVAEVGYWVPRPDNPRLGGGASWMRVDMEAAPVILACEMYLLTCDYPVQAYDGWVGTKYDPTIVDELQEVEQRVREAILETPSAVPWVIRWPVGRQVPEGVTEWHDAEKKAAYEAAMSDV